MCLQEVFLAAVLVNAQLMYSHSDQGKQSEESFLNLLYLAEF